MTNKNLGDNSYKKLENNDLKKVDGGKTVYYNDLNNKHFCSSAGKPKSNKSSSKKNSLTTGTLTAKKKKKKKKKKNNINI